LYVDAVKREARNEPGKLHRGCAGYLGHEFLQDLDDPGHILVVSRWSSREQADATLRDYADNPDAKAANRLVSQPRRRFVARSLGQP
jgi:heme-degrading monooxygenase HmoA